MIILQDAVVGMGGVSSPVLPFICYIEQAHVFLLLWYLVVFFVFLLVPYCRYEFREAEAVASKLATLEAVGSLKEKEDESKTEKGLLVEDEATSPSKPESNGQLTSNGALNLCIGYFVLFG